MVGYGGICYRRRSRFLRRTKRINPAAESSDRFPAFRIEPRSASWLNSYTMISYVPVWKLSARRYRGYHFPRWYVSSSGTSRRLEIIEVRRGIAHPIDYARCHWLGRARKRSCQKTRPQRREVWEVSVWRNIINVRKEKERGGRKNRRRKKGGLAPRNDEVRIRLMAAIVSAHIDVGLSSRQASISNWNSNCKCTYWKSTLNLLSGRDGRKGMCARRGTQRRSTVHRDWSKCSFGSDARHQPLSLYLLIVNIDRKKFRRSNEPESTARHRALSIATDDLCKSRLQLFAAFTLRVTLLLLPRERLLRYIYLQYGCP